jgi:tRNA pseudouridine13 synthase
LHFSLFKENRETSVAIQDLAKRLKISAKRYNTDLFLQISITYAGTKDKRGITTQRVCVHKITAERLALLNGKDGLDISDKQYGIIRVGDFAYMNHDLKLGDLEGNRFQITLRDCQPQNITTLEACVESFRGKGYVNYFGLQRFGTGGEDSTHAVGRAVLRGDLDGAVDLIMRPKQGGVLLLLFMIYR